MGIDKLSDSNLVSQRCVVYVEMGKAQDLAILFGIMKITNRGNAITVNDIEEHAEAVCELWGVKQEGKHSCHVCDKPQVSHRLCSCYYETLITPFNLAEFYAKSTHKGNAFRYICCSCKKESFVPMQVVKSQYNTTGRYQMPPRCYTCHKAMVDQNPNAQSHGPKKRFQTAKLGDVAPKLAQLQEEAAQSSAIIPVG